MLLSLSTLFLKATNSDLGNKFEISQQKENDHTDMGAQEETVELNIKTQEEKAREKAEKEKRIRKEEIKKLQKSVIDYALQYELMSEKEVEEAIGEELPDDAWCAAFIYNTLINTCEKELPKWYTDGIYVRSSAIYDDAKENNALITDIDKVQKGDIIIIRRNNSEFANHVGLVISVLDDNSIETIEGNTTNPEVSQFCVSKKTRTLDNERYEILGFARVID